MDLFDVLGTSALLIFIFGLALWVIKFIVVYLEVGSSYGYVVVAFAIFAHGMMVESAILVKKKK